MKRLSFMIVVLVIGSAGVSHAWRDKVESLWPEKPVQIDGRATEWSEMPVVETDGLGIRAMNDASNLYLLIRGANDDGRILLSGNYRQTVTIWFLKPDRKTKAWGIALDFSRAHEPESEGQGEHWKAREMTHLSDIGMAPDMVLPQGLEVSTAPFPADFSFQADLTTQYARQPIYEIQIPLSMVERKGQSIPFDIVSSEVTPQVKAELQGRRSGESAGGEKKGSEGSEGGGRGGSPGGGRGGRHGRGMGGSPGGGGGSGRSVELPKPLNLHLTVALTNEPRH